MLPWPSNGVLRYAIILSLGWSALAWIVVATSGALVGDAVPSPTGPPLNRVVQIDGSIHAPTS